MLRLIKRAISAVKKLPAGNRFIAEIVTFMVKIDKEFAYTMVARTGFEPVLPP